MAKRKKAEVATVDPPEPTEADIEAVQQYQQLNVPEWYAAGAQLVIAGNDATLLFTKPMLLAPHQHGGPSLAPGVAMIGIVGAVRVSMATLKDLSVLLSEQVAKREAAEGAIQTQYTRKKAAQEIASKKKH